MDKKTRNRLIIAPAILILFMGISGYLLFFARTFHINQPGHIYIDKDDTADSVYYKIGQAGKPAFITGFKLLSWIRNYPESVRTGHFLIKPGDNIYRLFRNISKDRQTPVKLAFNNIRTREKLAAVIGKQLMADSTEISKMLHDSLFCAEQGYKEETIISLFIPNTYEVYWNITPEKLFERMQKEYRAFWNEERTKKASEIGFTPTEVITLASIVEEETNNNKEKSMVAGLYINRLHQNMPLQADPTVKFGLQEFGLKRIRGNHLSVDSPYNTYKFTGLPPGPIRIPSIKGIDAVLNYVRHDYIYMCAKEDFSGTHSFASTFAAHQENAKRYWKALNEQNIH